jgi:hypothetical protein
MKKKLMVVGASIFLLSLMTGDYVSAQEPLLRGNSSAGIINQPVWFNCDFADDSVNELTLHYKTQAGTDFTVATLAPVNQPPYYGHTYEANVIFTENPGIVEYYFSAIRDGLLTTQSPQNASNQFPPSAFRYAQFLADPQGDLVGGSAGNWLDLLGSGMTYSNTKLYCYLQNVTGSWPLNSGLTYFAYSMGFLITDGADSQYYALVYASIPLILTSGVYIVNQADSTFSRLGDISYSISGGLLHMSCNLSTFTADPNWPGWPPPDGYIEPLGATLTAGLSGQFTNDFTSPTIFQPQTQYLDFNTNAAPVLPVYTLAIDSGASIMPRITYFDLDNNLPTIRKLYFDADSFTLYSADHVYNDSSEFETTIGWPADGWHRYFFRFSDGQLTTATPMDSILIGDAIDCRYLPGDINSDEQRIGGDVTFGVRFFKGVGPQPPDSCYLDSTGAYLYVAGDVNGNCEFRGSDITRLVAFFKGTAPISYCHFFPPPLR